MLWKLIFSGFHVHLPGQNPRLKENEKQPPLGPLRHAVKAADPVSGPAAVAKCSTFVKDSKISKGVTLNPMKTNEFVP